MKDLIFVLIKGVAMGAANVIPGVSGGTIAFVTGIYDRLISALKSFDLTALKLLAKLSIKEFAQRVDLTFLIALFSGAVAGIVSFGKVLKYLVEKDHHAWEIYVWGFFFGLILASVFLVGKTIKKWDLQAILVFLLGAVFAVSLAFIGQASENDNGFYLIICGVVAMSSMLLPGLSGSFVLILMGNYYLIMLQAVEEKNVRVLGLVALGAILGFFILSRVISFLLAKYENVTISGLTGFILGSLVTIWPWKNVIRETVTSRGKEKEIILGYDGWSYPSFSEAKDVYVVLFLILGFALVFGVEWLGSKFKSEKV